MVPASQFSTVEFEAWSWHSTACSNLEVRSHYCTCETNNLMDIITSTTVYCMYVHRSIERKHCSTMDDALLNFPHALVVFLIVKSSLKRDVMLVTQHALMVLCYSVLLFTFVSSLALEWGKLWWLISISRMNCMINVRYPELFYVYIYIYD